MSVIRKYKATVKEIRNPLKDVFTVSFQTDRKFQYSPGQFLHLALDTYDPSMQWPDSRCFSMQSVPQEEYVTITYAVKGKFTQRMSEELCTNKTVWLKMPYGDLFQRQHLKDHCVFIAGGTGITPFLSLFGDASFTQYQEPKLYFGVRSKAYNVFDKELCDAQKVNPQFSNAIVYQDIDGILDIGDIYTENKGSTFFISGPPIMISSFKKFLISHNSPEEKVITDDWE